MLSIKFWRKQLIICLATACIGQGFAGNTTGISHESADSMLASWLQVPAATVRNAEPDPYDRIIHFHADIKIMPDGAVQVRESILIYNSDHKRTAADEIQRGIIRLIPIRFNLGYRLNRITPVSILSITRNQKPENWALYETGNAAKIMIGSRHQELDPGIHCYDITYQIRNVLVNVAAFDEIYWNVTGQAWTMPLDGASATVTMPAAPLSYRVYAGKQGDTAATGTITRRMNDTVLWIARKDKLLPGEGLTFAASWPKGHVEEQGLFRQAYFLFMANRYVSVFPITLFLILAAGWIFWLLYGRDQIPDIIYPQFQPPEGFAPAELGFIYRQEHKSCHTVASLIDLALQGSLSIRVNKKTGLFGSAVYHLVPQPEIGYSKRPYPSFINETGIPGEVMIEKGEYAPELASFDSAVRRYCEHKYKKNEPAGSLWILNNHAYLVPGNVMLILAFVWSFWWFVKEPLPNPWGLLYAGVAMIMAIGLQGWWYRLMPGYGKSGQALLSSILGFRMYLTMAETEEMDLMNAPEHTPDLYYRYLPYAVALDCEIAWSNKFSQVLETAVVSDLHVRHIGQSLINSGRIGDFGASVISASVPPSSGSGGTSFSGGSAGGGAGGGGGSGW